MSFIQIGFLGALAAMAIPIVIHLVFRQKTRKVELGTLRFLRAVLEQNARRRRVMRWLLLALRLACVALLAVLFARPYWLGFRAAGEKATVAVLIDRSATMELEQDGARLVERAVAAVRELLAQAADETRFEIAFFDHAVRPLNDAEPADGTERREISAAELSRRLSAPEACFGGTDYGAAMDWARDVLAKAPPGPRRLHVFTDLQRSGLAWSEVAALGDDVETSLHDLGRSAVNNLAVTEARAERVWLRPNEATSVHATLHNGGPFSTEELSVVLRLTDGDRKLELRDRVKIEPGAAESLRFDLPPLAAGLWQGKLLVEAGDDLPLDNERYVAILAAKPYQALLVDGRSAASPWRSATHFLEASLRLAPSGELNEASSFEPTSVAADDLPSSFDRFDVVVLADAGALAAGELRRLAQFVSAGGKLLVFGGESVSPQAGELWQAAGLAPGKIAGVQMATDLPLRLDKWELKHPIFKAFSDPQLGDLRRLAFSACLDVAPAGDARVLASFRGGKPAFIERSVGKGSLVWFTSSADRQWSDWPRSRLYLPLVYQLLGYQTGLTAGGRVRAAVLEGAVDLPADARPGIVSADGYSLVVNTSPREAETERCTAEEYMNRFGLKEAEEGKTKTTEAAAQRAALGTEMIDSELWPWVAALVLAALIVEALVANRTTA